MTPRQPVAANIRSASSAERTSPLPMTGMRTAAATAPIGSQRAGRQSFSRAVRPWTTMASAPAD
jgi:hypothetical protein